MGHHSVFNVIRIKKTTTTRQGFQKRGPVTNTDGKLHFNTLIISGNGIVYSMISVAPSSPHNVGFITSCGAVCAQITVHFN